MATARGTRLRELDFDRSLGTVLPRLSISLDEKELADLTRRLGAFPGLLERSLLAATNRTSTYLRRQIVTGLRGIATLTPASIGRAVRRRAARDESGRVQAEVRVAGYRIPLSRYAVRPERPPRLKGVAVSARQRISYKLRQRGESYGDRSHEDDTGLSSLFVQHTRSGHTGVFYRVKGARGKNARTRIKEEFGPAVQYHMYADGFIDSLEQRGRAYFMQQLRAEIKAHGVKS